MQEVERSAQSVEEALEAALAALGASEQDVDVEIVQEPKGGGLLRRGSQEAIVRVRRRRDPTAPTQEELEEGMRRPCCWPGCKHSERNGIA